jgi:hypothetical protein
VISGSSSARYAKNSSAAEIAKNLHADAIVEGAILRDADHLSADVRLVQGSDDRTLWSARYALTPHDLLSTERTVDAEITNQLRAGSTGGRLEARATGGTGNVEAYDEYLQGRFFWQKRTEAGYWKAIDHFQRAIRRERPRRMPTANAWWEPCAASAWIS